MSHAATPAKGVHALAASGKFSARFGGLTYTLTDDVSKLTLAVADVRHTATQSLDWVIGAGSLGQTMVFQRDGAWYQSRLSLYSHGQPLDRTTGLGLATDGRVQWQSLGQRLSPEDARACFRCHTVHASSPEGFNPSFAEPGIGCEACHGPGAEHVRRMQAPGNERNTDHAIFDPARLSPADLNDFCGACHRTFADATLATGPEATRAAVRFQPYRLEQSRCWRATQSAKLTCTGCHDPHSPLKQAVQSYDSACLSCHSKASHGSVCPRSTHDCSTCHMPKVRIASVHGDFTDHDIRVVRPGDELE